MKQSVKAVAVLTLLCAVVALGLGIANYFTADRIAQNSEAALNQARSAVLPEGSYSFEELTDSLQIPEASSVTAVWAAQQNGETVAYVFQMNTKGYAAGLVLTCGVSLDGTVTGTQTVSSNETPSLGGKTELDSYKNQYIGIGQDGLASIDGISGATKTSAAYQNAVRDALDLFRLIKGGEG